MFEIVNYYTLQRASFIKGKSSGVTFVEKFAEKLNNLKMVFFGSPIYIVPI